MDSNISASTADTESEKISNQCWLRTKGSNYKDYLIEIRDGAVEFNRGNSSKKRTLSYPVDSFLCIVTERVEGDDAVAHPHRLLLVKSDTNQREVFFDSDEDLKLWRSHILTAQSCRENRLDQYTLLSLLGEGSFGQVHLAQHKTT